MIKRIIIFSILLSISIVGCDYAESAGVSSIVSESGSVSVPEESSKESDTSAINSQDKNSDNSSADSSTLSEAGHNEQISTETSSTNASSESATTLNEPSGATHAEAGQANDEIPTAPPPGGTHLDFNSIPSDYYVSGVNIPFTAEFVKEASIHPFPVNYSYITNDKDDIQVYIDFINSITLHDYDDKGIFNPDTVFVTFILNDGTELYITVANQEIGIGESERYTITDEQAIMRLVGILQEMIIARYEEQYLSIAGTVESSTMKNDMINVGTIISDGERFTIIVERIACEINLFTLQAEFPLVVGQKVAAYYDKDILSPDAIIIWE